MPASSSDPTAVIPVSLLEIRDDFLALENQDRLMLLLEFSDELPELPEEYQDHPDLFERVLECQAPVYIFPEVTSSGEFNLYATAPKEAPTTRGFASILVEGLNPLTPQEVLSVPDDFPMMIGLTEAVSPLRMRGMMGMLGRIKRSVRDQLAQQENPPSN
jgi:cysteine desulfuration protein SufE